MDALALNAGIEMAMEFGQNWLRPIHERMSARYPLLSESELDGCDKRCREAMKFGHLVLRECWRAASSEKTAAFRLFRQRVLAVYPWVSPANLEHLFSQGCYYAWKDGELE